MGCHGNLAPEAGKLIQALPLQVWRGIHIPDLSGRPVEPDRCFCVMQDALHPRLVKAARGVTGEPRGVLSALCKMIGKNRSQYRYKVNLRQRYRALCERTAEPLDEVSIDYLLTRKFLALP